MNREPSSEAWQQLLWVRVGPAFQMSKLLKVKLRNWKMGRKGLAERGPGWPLTGPVEAPAHKPEARGCCSQGQPLPLRGTHFPLLSNCGEEETGPG